MGHLRTLVAAALMLVAAGCSSAATGTSLQTPVEHGWINRAEVGDIFSDGMETLEVVDGPITLRAVNSIGPQGVTQLGFSVVPSETAGDLVQEMPGYPPAITGLVNGEGAVIGQGGGPEPWGLVVGYRVDSDSRWERTGLEVVYQKGDRTYRQKFPATLIVCTPSTPEADCWDDRLGER